MFVLMLSKAAPPPAHGSKHNSHMVLSLRVHHLDTHMPRRLPHLLFAIKIRGHQLQQEYPLPHLQKRLLHAGATFNALSAKEEVTFLRNVQAKELRSSMNEVNGSLKVTLKVAMMKWKRIKVGKYEELFYLMRDLMEKLWLYVAHLTPRL